MTEIDPKVVERMMALVQALADVPRDTVLGRSGYTSEARAIVAELPAPVDPDLLEARRFAVDLLSRTIVANGNPAGCTSIQLIEAGHGDANSYVVSALAAIKRGRALAAPTTEAGRGEGMSSPRCSVCKCRSFAAVDTLQFDGTFAPGPERRCVECKTTFTAQAFAALDSSL